MRIFMIGMIEEDNFCLQFIKYWVMVPGKWFIKGHWQWRPYNLEIGLLINFGEPGLKFKRLANKKFKSLHDDFLGLI